MAWKTQGSDAAECARFFERYAKGFGAGAFATPLRTDIASAMDLGRIYQWGSEALEVLGYATVANGTSSRSDFTGARYVIPQGSRILAYLARLPGASVPSLDEFDYVYAYQEDFDLIAALRAQGRECRAVRISAASEIIGCYARAGQGFRYPSYDAATLTQIPMRISTEQRADIAAEVEALAGWHDDYPYYNKDGSWSALSLRGFKPDDPTWGIKPSEMSKAWLTEHPDARRLRTCDWTTLIKRVPATMDFLTGVSWWRGFERIRFLKLSGRGGKGGKLLRHTDITDRTAGTADGQIARFHLPIVTDPAVRTVAWDLEGHEISRNLEAWRLYYLDQRKPHMVLNPADVERVHLVVDVRVDSAVRERIGASA